MLLQKYFMQKCGITPTECFKGLEPESSYALHYVSNHGREVRGIMGKSQGAEYTLMVNLG